MSTIVCPLCGNAVRSWWKTTLHPGCSLYWAWERNRRLADAMPILRRTP